MAISVNSAFGAFQRDIVNLDSERTKIARASRDWLLEQLIKLPGKVHDFPRLYEGLHIQYGSFARNTKIRPLDDIDMILTFSADGTTYLKDSNSIILITPEASTNLWNLCNDDGTLNSIKVINKIISSLSDIPHYKDAEIHRRQEAVTLELTSYEWNYDIVPAFYTDLGYYVIPNGQGKWMETDPRKDQNRVNEITKKHGKMALQLIRTLKFWNKRAMMITIPSYLFENIILNYLSTKATILEWIDLALIDFWNNLQTSIYYAVSDPKGFQGDLNTLTYAEKTNVANKARDAYNKGYEAFEYEKVGDQQLAINKWREIFGNNFPKYE